MPRTIGAAVSSGKATIRDLGEALSLEDLYDILEIAAVDAHNIRLLHPKE